ncbi:MAG: FIST N-terminal domain-containing protein [Syntrophales bacterium]|nr:FIST N-terminal domain-containing protein [Syntrophales bacterium]
MFGSPSTCKKSLLFHELKSAYPNAHFLGCSTAGEISGTQVFDDSMVITAISFEDSWFKGAKAVIEKMEDSFDVGRKLAEQFAHDDLVHVFVLSEGININGSELVKGLITVLPEGVSVTGGLAGDGDRFQKTYVCWDSEPEEHQIAALGLYGKHLHVGYGSFGGWDSFGPERLITRSCGNILYEFDGKSALELYKRYLGNHAQGLPATGLLFPLLLRTGDSEKGIVRTILAVNEEEQSLTFAGDVPEGAYARLMKANFDRLIDGAVEAAKRSQGNPGDASPDLAILISCVGRKLILQQRVEEEVEGVQDILGLKTIYTGFYSYGEISPFSPGEKCELHNQTMTITTIFEAKS